MLKELKRLIFGEKTPQAYDYAEADIASASSPVPGLAGKLSAGTFQLIGLDRVRAALNGSWDARREGIYSIVEGIFRRRLTPQDVFYRVDEASYLVLFVRLDRNKAAFKAKALSEEIQRQIMGELPGGHQVTVSSSITEIDRQIALDHMQSLDELVSYVRAAASMENAGNAGSADITLFDIEDGPPIIASSGPLVGPGPDMADLDQPLIGLFRKKTTGEFLKECLACFEPVFNLQRRKFASYYVSVLHSKSGKRAMQYNDPLVEMPEELPFYIDRYALTAGLLGLHRMLTAGRSGMVVVPVRFDTLAASRYRDTYLVRLREIPEGVRRFVGFDIRAIPDGTPASRLGEILSLLRPLSGDQAMAIHPNGRMLESVAASGCTLVSTTPNPDQPDTGRARQELAAFVKRARLFNLSGLLHEAATPDQLHIALSANFDYLSGTAVAPRLETPGLVEKLKTEHLRRGH